MRKWKYRIDTHPFPDSDWSALVGFMNVGGQDGWEMYQVEPGVSPEGVSILLVFSKRVIPPAILMQGASDGSAIGSPHGLIDWGKRS